MNDQPKKAGLYASAAMHAGLLAILVFGFSFAPKFEDAGESIPVETVSQNRNLSSESTTDRNSVAS